MPISEKHNLLFIHNPKCGGSSIEQYFGMSNRNNISDRKILFGLEMVKNRMDDFKIIGRPYKNAANRGPCTIPLQHLTPTQMIDLEYLSKDKFLEYVSVVFVRNPWDRLVSSYVSYYQKKYPDFNQFLVWVRSIVDHEKTNEFFIIRDGRRVVNTHFREQHMYVNYKDQRIVNYVGRYENYEEEVKELCEILEVEYTGIGKANATKDRRHYSTYYNDQQKMLVEDIYQKDIELFDYKFERI